MDYPSFLQHCSSVYSRAGVLVVDVHRVDAARDCQDPGHFRRKAQLRTGLDSVMYSPRRMAPDFQVPVDGR